MARVGREFNISSPRKITTNIAIVGGGLIGLSLALGLARLGYDCVLIEKATPQSLNANHFDGRATALSPTSRNLYTRLGVWSQIHRHAQPIHDILVSDGNTRQQTASSFLHFAQKNADHEAVGYFVENRYLRRILSKNLGETAIKTLFSRQVQTMQNTGSTTQLLLDNGQIISCRLVLACDGRHSPLRHMAGISCFGWAYPQSAIVTTVAHELPHHGIAHEYFLPAGPFAILPIRGNYSSLVWTERHESAKAIIQSEQEIFNGLIGERFGPIYGQTSAIGPRWRYPLSLNLARRLIAKNLALIGDSAHVIHPIAGQGFNLGLRDVATMLDILCENQQSGLAANDPTMLARYENWRRFDIFNLALATDGLNRLFSNPHKIIRALRLIGMMAAGRIGFLRKFLMREASGQAGSLPRFLRPVS